MKLINKKFFIITLGCRVNILESNNIIEELTKKGAIHTTNINLANFCIINTCCVTNNADKKSKLEIQYACNKKNIKLVVVIGCYSQLNHALITNKKVGIILGTKFKTKLAKIINKWKVNKKIILIEDVKKNQKFEDYSITKFNNHTRAFLKIQDGCNYDCSYCLIPQSRGSQRSMKFEKVIFSIKKLINNNFKEIILTGVNTAGYNDGVHDFYDLLLAIDRIRGDFRIRISSLEPFQITNKIIDLLTKNKRRWVQSFHICLQSTSDKILKSMRRRYTFNKFKKLCEYIKKKSPLASITTDYIVGYPSETLKEFNNSIEKIKKLKLANMHIFRYSKRKNTVAEKITDIVGDAERKRRFEIINNLNIEMKNNYFKKFINKRISILFENSSDSSVQIGHSNYFFTVKVISNINMQNILKEVIITKIQNNELYGII